MKMNEMQNGFVESMDMLIKAAFAKSNATISIEAEVVKIIDSGIGLYEVAYMGSKFQAYSSNQSIQYTAGNKVYIIVPDGDFSKQKIIIGASAPSGSTYVNLEDNLFNYLEKSDNLLGNVSNIELCTYKTEIDKKINIENNNIDSSGILSYFFDKNYNHLVFSFQIKTEIPKEQRAKGNYGLKLQLPFKVAQEDGTKKTEWRNYILDINNMLGDPYGFIYPTTQRLIIKIDNVAEYDNDTLPQLSAFVKDFDQAEEKPMDIFISNISLKVIDVLEDSQKSGYFLSIAAEQGEVFGRNYKENKKLTPILKVNGKNTSIENTDCYWFVMDNSIDETSEYYNTFGGRGWKCLNKKTETTSEYIKNNYEYIVRKTDVKTSLTYKCVIIYEGNQISSEEISITNLDSKIQIELFTSTDSTVYTKSIGDIYLTCRVYYEGITNVDEFADSIRCNWTRQDKNKQPLNTEFTIIRAGKVRINDKVYHETQVHFKNSIDEVNTIQCTVNLTQVVDSIVETSIIGSKNITLTIGQDFDYRVIIENGDVLYKYDADGNSPLVANYNGPESASKEIKPLSYKMFKKDGTELTEEEYKFCEAKWKVPKNSMIEIDDSNNVIAEEDELYYIIRNTGKGGLPYSIISQFNASKANNTILLEVAFDNNIVNTAATIKFIKDGAGGTNGTTYAAIITHQGYGYRELDAQGRARKLQLIYIKDEGWKYYNIDNQTLVDFNNPAFDILIYREGQLVKDFSGNVTWDIFDANATDPCFAMNDNVLSIEKNWENPDDIFCNIVRAEIQIAGDPSKTTGSETLYAYYPIEITYLKSKDFASATIPTLEGGFSSVLYASDGTNPKYDTTFDFQCYDSLYNEDVEDIYDYNWSVSENLIKGNSSLTENTDSSCRIRPREKYDNGNSKNYVKVILDMSEAKKQQVAEMAEEHSQTIAILDETITNFENCKNYLTNLASEYKYYTWLSALQNSKSAIEEREVAIIELNNALIKLKDIEDFCDKNGSLLVDILDYLTIIQGNRVKINEAKNAVYNLHLQDSIDVSSLISLVDYHIVLTDEQVEQLKINLGDNSFYYFSNYLINFYNNSLDKYELYFTSKNASTSHGDYIFHDLITYLQDFCNNSNWDNLQSSKFIEKEFRKTIRNFVSFQSLSTYYTYANINEKILMALKKQLELYLIPDPEKRAEVGGVFSSSAETRISQGITGNTRKKEEEEFYYDKYNKTNNVHPTNIIHIRPIIMTYNRYELSAINNWDGNKIYTGNNNDFLFAPQIGAGKKEDDNSFTGMVMGLRKRESKIDVGLFGYHRGDQSIFLDAEDGSATFGKSGAGQIVLKPGESAMIYGGNYDPREPQEGLCIDLTTPEIKFGSGNFEVNEDGFLTAKGGGSIAGWVISDTKLFSNNMEISSENGLTITNEVNTITFNPDNTEVMNVTNHDKKIFYLNELGDLFIDGHIFGGSLFLQNDEGTYVDINPDKENILEIGVDKSSIGNKYEKCEWQRLTTGLNAAYESWTDGGFDSVYYQSRNYAKNICQNQVAEKNGKYYLIFGYLIKVFQNGEWETIYDMTNELSSIRGQWRNYFVKTNIYDNYIYIFSTTSTDGSSSVGYCRLSRFNILNNTFTVMYKFDLSYCNISELQTIVIKDNRLYNMSNTSGSSKYLEYAWYCDIELHDDDSNYSTEMLTVTMATNSVNYVFMDMFYVNDTWYAIVKNTSSKELQLIKMTSLENRTGTFVKTLRSLQDSSHTSPGYYTYISNDISSVLFNNLLYIFWLGDTFSRNYANYWVYDFEDGDLKYITENEIPSMPILDGKRTGNNVYGRRGIFTIVDNNKIHLFNETIKASYSIDKYDVSFPDASSNIPTYLAVSEHYVLDENYKYLKDNLFTSLEYGKDFLSSQQKCFTSIGNDIYCLNSLKSLRDPEYYKGTTYAYLKKINSSNDKNEWETLKTITTSNSPFVFDNFIYSNSKNKIYFHYCCNNSYNYGWLYGVGYYDTESSELKYYGDGSFGDIWKIYDKSYTGNYDDCYYGDTSPSLNNEFCYYDEENDMLYSVNKTKFRKQDGFGGSNLTTIKELSYKMLSNIIWTSDTIYYIASNGSNYALYSMDYNGNVTNLSNVTNEMYSDDIGFSICLHYGKINILYSKHGVLHSSRYVYYIKNGALEEKSGVFQDNGLYTVENSAEGYKTCFVSQISTESGIHIFVGYPTFTTYSTGENGGYRHYLLKETQSADYQDMDILYVTKDGEGVFNGTVYAKDGVFSGDVYARSLVLGSNSSIEGMDNFLDTYITDYVGNSNIITSDNFSYKTETDVNGITKVTTIIDGVTSTTYSSADGNYVLTNVGLGDESNTFCKISSEGLLEATNAVISGQINAGKGYIAGWKIEPGKLSSNDIEINSEGSLSGGTNYEWSINKEGMAKFNYLTADSGGSIGGWKITTNEERKFLASESFGDFAEGTEGVALFADGHILNRGKWNIGEGKEEQWYSYLYHGKWIFGIGNYFGQVADERYCDISVDGIYMCSKEAIQNQSTQYLFAVDTTKDTVKITNSSKTSPALTITNNFYDPNSTNADYDAPALVLHSPKEGFRNRPFDAKMRVTGTTSGTGESVDNEYCIAMFGEENNGRITFRSDRAITTANADGTVTITRVGNKTDDQTLTVPSTIGTAWFRWYQGFFMELNSTKALEVSSDKKVKNHIQNIKTNKSLDFINSLNPVEYTLKNNSNSRKHMGFYAQDVKQACDNMKLGNMSLYSAVWIKDNKENYYSEEAPDEELQWTLKYEEFIAPLVGAVQELSKKVEALETQLKNINN